MAEAISAAFKFEKFKIPNFFYDESSKDETTLNLDITPRGNYKNGIFNVEVNLTAWDCEERINVILRVKCIATFQFVNAIALNEIPSYFYQNSIAIVFPYIRAFISNLTLQANTGLIILGLLNLSNLERVLIENTVDASSN